MKSSLDNHLASMSPKIIQRRLKPSKSEQFYKDFRQGLNSISRLLIRNHKSFVCLSSKPVHQQVNLFKKRRILTRIRIPSMQDRGKFVNFTTLDKKERKTEVFQCKIQNLDPDWPKNVRKKGVF